MDIKIQACASIIDFFSSLSDKIQNLLWLGILIFMIFVLVISLFSIRRKANKFTNEQINHF